MLTQRTFTRYLSRLIHSRFRRDSSGIPEVPLAPSYRPYPVSVRHRDVANEPPPVGSGLECFETPEAQAINRARLHHLRSLGLNLAGKRVLDVGCGVGHLAQFFCQQGCQVICVDGREENISALRTYYPHLQAHVADVEVDPLSRFGTFDVVFCYGLLYHLANPLAGLRNMAAVCRELLLLETCVCDHPEPILYLVDELKTMNQALGHSCLGTRPSPAFVTMALNRIGFPFIYAPRTQPDFPDFQLQWKHNLDICRDGHLLRCTFVASRAPLANEHLQSLLATS